MGRYLSSSAHLEVRRKNSLIRWKRRAKKMNGIVIVLLMRYLRNPITMGKDSHILTHSLVNCPLSHWLWNPLKYVLPFVTRDRMRIIRTISYLLIVRIVISDGRLQRDKRIRPTRLIRNILRRLISTPFGPLKILVIRWPWVRSLVILSYRLVLRILKFSRRRAWSHRPSMEATLLLNDRRNLPVATCWQNIGMRSAMDRRLIPLVYRLLRPRRICPSLQKRPFWRRIVVYWNIFVYGKSRWRTPCKLHLFILKRVLLGKLLTIRWSSAFPIRLIVLSRVMFNPLSLWMMRRPHLIEESMAQKASRSSLLVMSWCLINLTLLLLVIRALLMIRMFLGTLIMEVMHVLRLLTMKGEKHLTCPWDRKR